LRFLDGFGAEGVDAVGPSVSTFSFSAEILRPFTGNIVEAIPEFRSIWCFVVRLGSLDHHKLRFEFRAVGHSSSLLDQKK
jgi:hypothetical protein